MKVRLYVRVAPPGGTGKGRYSTQAGVTTSAPSAVPLTAYGRARPTFQFALDVVIPDSALRLAHATVHLPEGVETLEVVADAV